MPTELLESAVVVAGGVYGVGRGHTRLCLTRCVRPRYFVMAISNIRFVAKPTSGPQVSHQRNNSTASPLDRITGGGDENRDLSRRSSLRGPPMGLPSRPPR